MATSPPLVSELTNQTRASFEEQVAEIKARIGDENLARVIVATSRGSIQELQRFFRVSNVKYTWGDNGIRIDFDFQNFVVPTFDVDFDSSGNAIGEESSASVSTRTSRNRRGSVIQLDVIDVEGET